MILGFVLRCYIARLRFTDRYGGYKSYNKGAHYSAPHNLNGHKFNRSKTHGYHNSTARRKYFVRGKARFAGHWRRAFRWRKGLRLPFNHY